MIPIILTILFISLWGVTFVGGLLWAVNRNHEADQPDANAE
jgi:hypothetical protein